MPSNPNPSRSKVPPGAKAAAWRRTGPTTAQGPRYGVLGSLAFHALIFAGALFSFHNFRAPEETHIVPVDLVTLADTTNVQALAPPAPDTPQMEKLDIPTPRLEPPTPPPEPELAEPAPVPDAKMPQFDVAKPEPKPAPKPEPKPKNTRKQQQQDFAALLNKLTGAPKRPKNAKTSDRLVQGVGAGNAMTADLADALQSQIYRCWSPPIGAPNAQDLVVEFDLRLNPDGTVLALTPSLGSSAAAAVNTYTRASLEAARRAVYQCAPYHLPRDRYQVWREIDPLHFDPRQLMQQ